MPGLWKVSREPEMSSWPSPRQHLPESERTLGAGALTVLLGYGVQIGKSKGLSRKRSLATTKRPASTQKQLRACAIRQSVFYKQK